MRPAYVIPSPADVAVAFTQLWQRGDVQHAILTSLERGIFGFLASVAIATPLGILVARVRWVRAALVSIITGLFRIRRRVPLGACV